MTSVRRGSAGSRFFPVSVTPAPALARSYSSDEAVIAMNDLLEELYPRFQNHYFAQMHRNNHDPPASEPDLDQIPLPLPDPPF